MTKVTEYDFDPRNLPHDLLAAIGLAITSSTQTEHIMQDAIAGCAGIDAEYGRAITTHMPMPLRFSVLRSVAEIHIDDLDHLDELDELLKEVDTAINKRNDLAHNQWCREPKSGDLFVIKEKARTRYELDLLPMSIDHIKSEATFIYDVGIRFMRFLMARGLLPPASPHRPRAHKSKAARKVRRNKT